MKQKKHIHILGAGLVGSLLAVYLVKRGYKVSIYERRPDMRKEKISAGRSINLALSDRGWKGLQGAGLEEDIRKVAIPMKGRMVHPIDGNINFQPYGKEGQAIYSVSRGGLNCEMMNLAEKHGAEIIFNERCAHVDLANATIWLENQSTKKTKQVKCDLIIGADGAFSAARLALQLTDRFNYSQQYLEHGYKELSIDAGTNESFLLEKNALHIWPRGGYMLIALPNMDGSFTCTLFFPFHGKPSFEELNDENKVLTFFKEVFPNAVPLMPTLTKDFFTNPTGSLVTVKCFPWIYEDKVLLIGDAAHAIVPFYGQGMNCGFEDCRILNELLDEHTDDWKKAMHAFQQLRKPASDGIAELAVQNFIEMRDLVADKKFLLRKKIESSFYTKHPDKWIPLYSMVTFSDIPYNVALQEGRRQDAIMEKIMSKNDIEQNWNSELVEREILKLI